MSNLFHWYMYLSIFFYLKINFKSFQWHLKSQTITDFFTRVRILHGIVSFSLFAFLLQLHLKSKINFVLVNKQQ